MALGCAGAALVAAGCGLTSTKTRTETQTVTVAHTVTETVTTTGAAANGGPCEASDLTGTFSVLQGSAGAGNIVYTLRLTNASQVACFVTGVPTVQLLDANGSALPSHATADPGQASAPLVILTPGASASSQARFSPDVVGQGESGNPCEPVASTLRVSVGGGTLDVKIDPPTSVCSHGRMSLTNLKTAD